jgi:hypothetical protein
MFNYKTASYMIPLVAVSMWLGILAFAQKGQEGRVEALPLGLTSKPDAQKQQPSATPMDMDLSRPANPIYLNNDQEAISGLIKTVAQGMQTDDGSHGIIVAFGDLKSAKSAAFTQDNYSEQSKSTHVSGGDIDSYLSSYRGDDGPSTPTGYGKQPEKKDQTVSPSGISDDMSGVAVATIRTYADGTIRLNPREAATPIPAAVYLLGSGLLGLVVIRRKMAV